MKCAVLGMGYLARYILPCCKRLQGAFTRENMLGVKATPRNLEALEAACGFPVIAGGTDAALQSLRPDILIVAVKPHQVAALLTDTVAPYLDFLRAAGQPLPDIYSFAPNPTVDYYGDVLGPDVNVANMLPNMISSVGGFEVAPIAVSFISFDPRRAWPAEKRQRALDFQRPTGSIVEITPDIAVSYLSLTVACHLMFEFNYIAQDALAAAGVSATLGQTAAAYRAAFREIFDDPCASLVPAPADGVPARAFEIMRLFMRAWYLGMMDFAAREGIPADAAHRNACGTMEVFQIKAQLDPKEVLLENTREHATPGGFLEMAMIRYSELGAAAFRAVWDGMLAGDAMPDAEQTLRDIACEIAEAVYARGRAVSGIPAK